ncbi:Mu transposase C-terminal domain-containing protein [Clostridium cibarium]|uniref:DDE-type integrase/transposase/recombinase n=1 Tax=Clostridium cibarium TaxID=2762247 RepID=A0ABR8PUY0_9CLOT|nr:Mu transposase C-terminal domain-containing protein [Clostridium cibarium]MBD7911971.1 DDE-type integrase/transposase/recombinase [Clostridium cibarium]
MILHENMVLQYIEDDLKIRVICIDDSKEFCYIVKLTGDTAIPKYMSMNEMKYLRDNNYLIRVTDPFAKSIIEEDISDEQKLIRDEYWEVVENIWYENKKEFLDKRSRNKIITNTSIKFDKNEKQVRRIITRFFQRGMTKNSLLFDYENSGARGKVRRAGGKKRGRKRACEKDGQIIEGINIDEVALNIIKTSIRLFYSKKEKKSLSDAHKYMLVKFYSDKLIFNNQKRNFVWDKSRIPTYREFVYWYHKFEDKKEDMLNRESKRYYELHKRELLANSTMDTFGPGSRYEIDATVADVYLVSRIDHKKIIGRPVVYVVIDVFSRLVCGIYIGLEGPSWLGAMMALDNVVEDKVEFCSRYGIEITSEKWPNSFLSEKILADRGEFEGYNVENLINNLNVKIENTAPYRGDLKGIVERNFRTINERIKHMTPGAIAKEYRERGDRDYRLDAVLDINEFTSIIIHEVIHHNNSIISNYPMDVELIKAEIAPVPCLIWNWGIANRRCAFKYVEKDIVRLNLMYRKKISITRKGIQFNSKMFYSCELAIQEGWFLKRVNEKINIVYDPREMNFIYIPINNGREFIKCNLLDKCSRYRDLSIEEITFLQELEKESINDYQDKQNQVHVDNIESAEKIIGKAKERAKFISSHSDAKRIKGIRENRMQEKEEIRSNEGFELERLSNKIKKPKDYVDVDNSEQLSKIDILKKVRGEKVGR